MLKQYPHYLYVKVMSSESTQDGDGNWTESQETWAFHSICREQPNGKGNLINGVDGKSIVFSSAIYMPNDAARISEGSEVMVAETKSTDGGQRISGKVLKFHEGQLNCKLWL